MPNNVLETWSISIDYVRQESEMAYKILHVIAYMSNENIPHEIIAVALKYSGEDPNKQLEELEVIEAITRLKEFSFISICQMEDGSRNYEMHKLVQEATRYGLSVRELSTVGTENIPSRDTLGKESEAYFSSIALQVVADLFPILEQEMWS